MSKPRAVIPADGSGAAAEAPVHRFAHPAMGTMFEILIAGPEREYARQAAAAAFEELDRLHTELSRFNPASDVSRINALRGGQAVRVGPATLECLQAAARVHAETGGAFDPTIGRLYALWRPADGSTPHPTEAELEAARLATGMTMLELMAEEHAVGVRYDGVRIDLGGIGKGYALDQMAALLADWSITAALMHGGESSLVALDAPPGQDGWPIALGGPKPAGGSLPLVRLWRTALSGSGSPPGMRHVIDPRTGRLAEGNLGAWAMLKSATLSDALSTAFLVMSPQEVEQYCGQHPDVSGMLLVSGADGPEAVRVGLWESQGLSGRAPRPAPSGGSVKGDQA